MKVRYENIMKLEIFRLMICFLLAFMLCMNDTTVAYAAGEGEDPPAEEGEDSEEEEEEASRYLSDDGRIVSVTYGTKNADGSYSAYKTFILNYNNFSVNVEYGDVTYTIPAYGYVVVMH